MASAEGDADGIPGGHFDLSCARGRFRSGRQSIAESKGYGTGFAWGFWLGVIGLLVVGLKPTMAETYQHAYHAVSGPKPSSDEWFCECGNRNAAGLTYCTRCGREKTAMVKVTCPHCGAKNKESNKVCFACGKPLAPSIGQAPSVEAAELLEKLSRLHESGVLTDDEFQQKKAGLLKRI